MINVRHPLARLYSVWRDKFRNGHPWFPYIRNRYKNYIDILEQKNMTAEDHEYSFEAFAELAALTPFDSQRDKHWQSMTHFCSPCQFHYGYITKQENAEFDYPAVLNISGYQQKYPKLHIPARSSNNGFTTNASFDISKIAKPYKNLSPKVIKNLYKNYFRCANF